MSSARAPPASASRRGCSMRSWRSSRPSCSAMASGCSAGREGPTSSSSASAWPRRRWRPTSGCASA